MNRDSIADVAAAAIAERLDREILGELMETKTELTIVQQIQDFIRMSNERGIVVDEVWLTTLEIRELLTENGYSAGFDDGSPCMGSFCGVNIMRKHNE